MNMWKISNILKFAYRIDLKKKKGGFRYEVRYQEI